jgi:prepilin-type N-terminal cleavage/methylation domain-containing protein
MGIIKRFSFTLLELLIVLIVVGILFVVGLMGMQNAIEKNRGLHARHNLMTIYNAQKRYRTDNGAYFPANVFNITNTGNVQYNFGNYGNPANQTLGGNTTPISNGLGIGLQDPYFRYSVFFVTPNTYLAEDIRLSGPCSGCYMAITQDNSTPVIGGNCLDLCPPWQRADR